MTDKINITETIAKEPEFSTFARLLNSSGAGTWLANDGEFTVFAPTNRAFEKVSESRINQLVNEPEQTKLKALLAYHIVPGRVMSDSLTAATTLRSVTGQELRFTNKDSLRVNGAGFEGANIEALNGVVHRVDSVLGPPFATERTATA